MSRGDAITSTPIAPKHPERICWGCDKYCRADDLTCGNGTIRTQHPIELFGEDWLGWSEGRNARPTTNRDAGTQPRYSLKGHCG